MAELDSIDLEPRHLKKIRSIFAGHLPYKKVWAYGSRVKRTASNTSDLDCVVFGATDSEIANAREAFDESDIPFEIQLLNWDTIPDDFKKNIKEGYFILQNKWDWKETTLSEVCYRIGDGLHGTPKYTIDTQYYFINGNNLKKGQVVITKNTKKIDYKEFQKYKKDLGLNTILLSINGTIGNLAKYNNELCVLSKSIAYLNIRDDIIKNFIYYLMLDSKFQKDISHNANGSTIKNVSLAQLKNYSILLPPLTEQKAIASVLSSIDYKIDLLHRQNNTLESIAETIFRQWFIEEADDGWEEGVLGDAIQLFDSKRMPISKIQRDKMKDGNLFPYYGAATIMDYINNYIFDGEYILLGEDGTVRTNEGYPILQYATGKFWVNNHAHVMQAKSPYNNFFLWCYLSKKNIDKIVTGAVQPKVNQANLKSLDFPKFPENLIEKFCSNTADIFSKIKHNRKQIKTLECLRDMLLPKLISGDIRVEYEEVL
jgi:type I restriction enzyme S subunit